MAHNDEKSTSRISPATMKMLTIPVVLVLCALVYIFVELRTQSAAPTAEIFTPKPTPTLAMSPAPTATPDPGTLKSIMIERLYDSGLYIVGTKKEDHYILSATEDDLICSLSLTLNGDYVRGFTLEIAGPVEPLTTKGASAIEQALEDADQKEYDDYLTYEDLLLRYMFPKLLDAIEREGAFPPNTSLAWVELAIGVRTNGETVQDAGNGYSFTGSCTRLGVLTLAVGLE